MEIEPTVNCLKKEQLLLKTSSIKFLVAGIGGVATTYALASHCFNFRPDLVIQAGIGGCFREVDLGQAFIIKEELFGDLGVWEKNKFRTIHDLKLVGKNQPPFKNGRLQNPHGKILALSPLKKVRGITVNEITTNKRTIRWYEQNYNPVVESMEGASFHYVCLQMNIPFIQLRSISNCVGERDKSNWIISEAIEILNEKLIFLLSELAENNETYFGI